MLLSRGFYNKFWAHSQKVGTIIEKFKFRQTHVRMGLKPHATYGEKDAKAPSSRTCALLVKAYIVNNKHIGYLLINCLWSLRAL